MVKFQTLSLRVVRSTLPLLVLLAALPLASQAEKAKPARSATEALALTGKTARVESGKKFFGDTLFAGSGSCKGCHESHYQSWRASWHSKMEQWPSASTVVGDFDNRRIQFRNLRVRTADGKDATINPAALTFRRGSDFYFTLIDQDNAANSQTWKVAKTLGGKWDQGYEVELSPENYYAAPVRWSVSQKDWIVGGSSPENWFVADGTPDGRPFRPEEMPRSGVAEAVCSGCHTTGYKYSKGSDGIWKAHMLGQGEIGIACESCHGPGAKHVDEAHAFKRAGVQLVAGKTSIVNPLTDLNAEQSTQLCGSCHGRGTHKEATELAFQTGFLPGDTDLLSRFRLWSYSGTNNKSESAHFWPNDWAARNRQQYQDFQKSGHYNQAGMSCITCHAFHGKTEGPQLRATPEALCVECHRESGSAMRPNAEMFAGSRKDEAWITCVDCHMARIGTRSRATSKSGNQWDVTSHVFAVASPQLEKTLGVRSACVSCHADDQKAITATGAAPPGHSVQQELIEGMRQRADEVRTAMFEVNRVLQKADMRKAGVAALVYEAQSKLSFVQRDNSLGTHNIGTTRKLLRESKALAEQSVLASTKTGPAPQSRP